MTGLTVSQVLASEYAEARRLSPHPSVTTARVELAAPARAVMDGGTHRRASNRLTWLHISLFLEDLPKREQTA